MSEPDHTPSRARIIGALVIAAAVLGVVALFRFGGSAVRAQGFDPFGLTGDAPVDVPKREILVGAAMDGIPALTDPKFVPAADATWLRDTDRVVGVVHNGEAKAYPTSILLWHEAVNDTVGGKPYLVTF